MAVSSVQERRGFSDVIGAWGLVAGLGVAACAPTGPCPDGFARDNDGNCVELRGGDGGGGSAGGDGGAPTGDNNGGFDLGSGSSSLVVDNQSAYTVWYLYADTCGYVDSPDLLGNDVLPPGYYVTFEGLRAGCYDLFAETEYGEYWSSRVSINGQYVWALGN